LDYNVLGTVVFINSSITAIQ
jgi:hypothetical protein